MTRTTWALVMALFVAVVQGHAPVQGQVVSVGEVECAEGTATGDLGITGLDCRGDCTLTMNERGEERSWSFSVEPTITGIRRGSPADGVLRAGDALVAVDGMLITTAEGGRRYASLEPGEDVQVRFRRNGRVREATIRAEATCPPAPAPAPAVRVAVPRVARVAPVPPAPDRPDTLIAVTVVPRVRVTTARVLEPDSIRTSAVVTVGPVQARGTASRARLGIGMSCGDCRQIIHAQTGQVSWTFTGPIEVTGVEAGGPADEAGIQIGDLITAVDGHALETPEGGAAFSNMEPGEPVRLTVVKRNGTRTEVRVVPDEEESVGVPLTEVVSSARPRVQVIDSAGVARAVVVSPEPPEPVRVPRPEPPERVESPEVSLPSPPAGLPLRFSGSLAGTQVEIRGDPVTVTQVQDGRVLLITSDGLWIRIRLPEGGEAPMAGDGSGS